MLLSYRLPETADRPLTPRQAEVVNAVVNHVVAHGFPPTLRELGAAVGVSSCLGVMETAQRAVLKGYLEHRGHTARGLVPTERARQFCHVTVCPACGRLTRELYACFTCPAAKRRMRCLSCAPRCNHAEDVEAL